MIGFFGPLLGGIASGIIGGIFGSRQQNQQHRQALDLSRQQLQNSLALGAQSFQFRQQEMDKDYGWKKRLADDGYEYNIRKTNLDDEITRRQNEQRFGFERTLANDNYAFRDRDRAERERAKDEEIERQYQMSRESTASARNTASRAFFGDRNFNRFAASGRGFNRFAARR